MEPLKSLTGHENVDVFGEAAKPVEEQGHCPCDGIRDLQLAQSLDNPVERQMNRASFLKVHASLPQRPLEVTAQQILVRGGHEFYDSDSPEALAAQVGFFARRATERDQGSSKTTRQRRGMAAKARL
jgi:hypothetical protein